MVKWHGVEQSRRYLMTLARRGLRPGDCCCRPSEIYKFINGLEIPRGHEKAKKKPILFGTPPPSF